MTTRNSRPRSPKYPFSPELISISESLPVSFEDESRSNVLSKLVLTVSMALDQYVISGGLVLADHKFSDHEVAYRIEVVMLGRVGIELGLTDQILLDHYDEVRITKQSTVDMASDSFQISHPFIYHTLSMWIEGWNYQELDLLESCFCKC